MPYAAKIAASPIRPTSRGRGSHVAQARDRAPAVCGDERSDGMDERRFDNLVRLLRAGRSRRRALAVLGAAFFSSAALSVRPTDVAALSKKARRRCKRAGGVVCSAGTPKSQCCSRSGNCVHGACACNAFPNDCPTDADGQCQCTPDVNGTFGCCDNNSCCNNDQPCTANDDCPPGSFCAPGCETGGHNVCTHPCIPGGSSG
jgi:hypothetical protein